MVSAKMVASNHGISPLMPPRGLQRAWMSQEGEGDKKQDDRARRREGKEEDEPQEVEHWAKSGNPGSKMFLLAEQQSPAVLLTATPSVTNTEKMERMAYQSKPPQMLQFGIHHFFTGRHNLYFQNELWGKLPSRKPNGSISIHTRPFTTIELTSADRQTQSQADREPGRSALPWPVQLAPPLPQDSDPRYPPPVAKGHPARPFRTQFQGPHPQLSIGYSPWDPRQNVAEPVFFSAPLTPISSDTRHPSGQLLPFHAAASL
ncbi:hypothetical protein H920_00456 [Fukomys damarensis]|uniref:Uncharacterized protein n=1 Tax=Fukomys damarensis TaxID=885580 RepID=A0A091EQP3_FUKDA|nr:hypothetical protein H920_00456 [Fukomys damarensis]